MNNALPNVIVHDVFSDCYFLMKIMFNFLGSILFSMHILGELLEWKVFNFFNANTNLTGSHQGIRMAAVLSYVCRSHLMVPLWKTICAKITTESKATRVKVKGLGVTIAMQ